MAPPKKGAAPKKKVLKKSNNYELSAGKLVTKKKSCPKCGPGIFMGEHADRTSCGKCGYTEFNKKE